MPLPPQTVSGPSLQNPLTTEREYVASFAQALNRSPHLSSFVQHIQFYISRIIDDLPLQPYIVASLKHLKSASFIVVQAVHWRQTQERTSFVELFDVLSPTLTRLHLTRLHFPDFAELIALVRSFSNLTYLSLVSCSFPTGPYTQGIDFPAIKLHPRRAHSLTSLTVRPLSAGSCPRFMLTTRTRTAAPDVPLGPLPPGPRLG
ncbi:hypothetical protein LXA43DRAFT_195893 [Ganoderma leucocontextum]|nr:hypothetical protein LXA43DRAFT_195893 [Ganoderma leucocontextum]